MNELAQYTRQEVIDEAKRLAEMLANTEEIDRFKALEAKVNQSEKIQSHIKKIKALQKQVVNLQAYGKKEALSRVEKELERLQTELDEIPVVSEFKEIQVTVNNVLQLVSTTISREVTNHIIRATGGNVLEGRTGKEVPNE